jgi:DNA phosphorothioation-dependent restriction protein DptG
MSNVDYNVESGKGYQEGASKFKPIKVEMKVSNVNKDQVNYWINEIANQYADLVVTNVNTGSDRIAFDIGSPSMSDLTAEDIKYRMEEYLTMNIPPFELQELKVQ